MHDTLTYSLAEAAARIPCKETWLAQGLRDGRFTGRKIAGRWRLTDDDLLAIIEACKSQPAQSIWGVDTLSPRSRAHRSRP